MYSIAIFGGSFDPVHNGHLSTSLNIQHHFHFDTYCFLPCKNPIIKSPTIATNEQRIKMLQLAIKPYPQFSLDLREIYRDTPSYMVNTLESFRNEHQGDSLTLIVGYDSFLSLPKWHQWEKIIDLAHLLVINRPQTSQHEIPDAINKLLANHQSTEENALMTKKSGVIYLFNAGEYPISSTEIRNQLRNKKDIDATVPIEVCQYIKSQGLYR